MVEQNRYRVIGGFLLIAIGIALLGFRLIPGVEIWFDYFQGWPMSVIAVGVVLFVLGLISNSPGMAVPAIIVSGIGGILLYQNNSGDWESWSYVWSLIPGFVGVGVLLSGLLEGRFRQEVSNGFWLIFISAALFVSFGAFLGGITVLRSYWPVALIFLGLWIIARSAFRHR